MPAVLIEVFSFLTCEETGLTRVHGWFESEDNGDFAMVVDTDDLYIMA